MPFHASLLRSVTRKVDGKLEEWTQYYHRLSAVTMVSTFPAFLGIRFQKPGDTEVACSLALVRELVARLGKRFFEASVLRSGILPQRIAFRTGARYRAEKISFF